MISWRMLAKSLIEISTSIRLPGASSKVQAVDGDQLRVEPAEVGLEHASVCAVQHPQPDAIARSDANRLVKAAVHGNGIAPAAVVHQVVHGVEFGVDLALLIQEPVIEHPYGVDRIGRRL